MRIDSEMSRNIRSEFIRNRKVYEIELQMSTVISDKYCGHSEMSIKFKYRYIDMHFGNFADMIWIYETHQAINCPFSFLPSVIKSNIAGNL